MHVLTHKKVSAALIRLPGWKSLSSLGKVIPINETCMWLSLPTNPPLFPFSPQSPTHPTFTLRWQPHCHIMAAWLFLQALGEGIKAANKQNITGREVAAEGWCGWNILHVLNSFFLNFIREDSGCDIKTYIADDTGCGENENSLWRVNPWQRVDFFVTLCPSFCFHRLILFSFPARISVSQMEFALCAGFSLWFAIDVPAGGTPFFM